LNVFLSWSGERSRHVAQAFKEWLPIVFDDVDPWLSTRDIQAGGRWGTEIGRHLEEIDFGIICLTPENLEAPWIHFEAGALSKALDESYVCPYLFDIEVSAITGPLLQFQATRAEKASTLELLRSINAAVEHPMRETEQLARRFEGLWPEFRLMLESVPEVEGGGQGPDRPTGEILEELVETVRAADRRILDLHARLGPLETITAERRPDPRLTQPPTWQELMVYMKGQRHASAAAVYGEASPVWDGDRLLLIYPEERGFHVGMARDPGHLDKLIDAVEEFYGVLPKEVTVLAQGSSREDTGA
jgi:hypothetical protein